MDAFIKKPERRKKVVEDNRVTLGKMHNEIVSDYKNSPSDKKKLEDKLVILLNEYENQKTKDYRTFNEIASTREQIEAIKVKKDSFDEYMVNTSLIRFEYNNRHEEVGSGSKNADVDKGKDVDANVGANVGENENGKKHTISQIHAKYMSIVDPFNHNYMSDDEEDDLDSCDDCNGFLVRDTVKGCISCADCGKVCDNQILFAETPEFSDMDRFTIKTPFHYEKSSNFEKIMKQFQAKSMIKMSMEDVDIIEKELIRNKIDAKNANNDILKNILKTMSRTVHKRFAKYYGYIPYLMSRFYGVEAPNIDCELEDKLNMMFVDTEKLFNKYIKGRPEFNNRSSILNIKYLMYKFLQLLGGEEGKYDEILQYFPLLKSREKMMSLDLMWKEICKHNPEWTFIQTV